MKRYKPDFIVNKRSNGVLYLSDECGTELNNKLLTRLQKKIVDDYLWVDRKVIVTLLFGSTGTGKTFDVFEFARLYGYKVFSIRIILGDIWFDLYNGQEILLIDYFYGNGISLHKLIRYISSYGLKGKKYIGGNVKLRYFMVFITSSISYNEWYERKGYDLSILEQKIDNIFEYRVEELEYVIYPNSDIITYKFDTLNK